MNAEAHRQLAIRFDEIRKTAARQSRDLKTQSPRISEVRATIATIQAHLQGLQATLGFAEVAAELDRQNRSEN